MDQIRNKILFLVLHRKGRSPGQRYRHEQYLEYFNQNGIECVVDPLLKTEKEDRIFYGRNLFPKILIGIKALLRRVRSVIIVSQFDTVYIYRDAFFFSTFFEKVIARRKVNIVYDFDDAIWLMDENPNQGVFNRLKSPSKTSTIISLSDRIIVGNEYLASFANQYHQDVQIIPSTIDFNQYLITKNTKDTICIGWTGSFSTIKHFETIIPALESIKEKYGDKVTFKLIGDPSYSNTELNIQGLRWSAETEVSDLSELDIGIMPLPDNEWTQGKCAMKGLQYMALEIPTIMSPVGVNSEIINEGKNGMLASSTEEWVQKLSELIDNSSLRKQMGKEGRKTILKDFSVEANKEKWLKAFQF